MKKKLILLSSAGAFALAPIAFIVSCSSSTSSIRTETKTQVTAESPRIALADPDNPRWIDANNQILNAFDAQKTGASSFISKNQNSQNSFLISAVTAGSKGIIVGAVDDGAASAVNFAADKGIPVVAYDRLIRNTTKYHWYTTFDNAQVGTFQGLYIISGIYGRKDNPFKSVKEINTFLANPANKLKSETFIYTLAGAPEDNNSKFFYNGAINVIKDAMNLDPNLKFLRGNSESFESAAISNWDYSVAQSTATTFLTSKRADKDKLKAFLTPNDLMATAAIAAMNASGFDPSKVYITGQDFNPQAAARIEAGTQIMSIYKPDSELSKVAAEILLVLMQEAKKTSSQTKLTFEQIFEEVKSKLPTELQSKIRLVSQDDTNNPYVPVAGQKPVNTIILTPTVVDSSNIAQLKSKAV